jgi:hypothetical protein
MSGPMMNSGVELRHQFMIRDVRCETAIGKVD